MGPKPAKIAENYDNVEYCQNSMKKFPVFVF